MLDGISTKVTGTQLVDIIKNWRGDWNVDTSVDIQLTKNEKIQVLTGFTKELTGYTQLNIMSEAEIKPIRDAVWAKISLLNFNDVFQSGEISEFFTSIATKNQKMAQQAQQTQQASPEEGGDTPSPLREQTTQDQAAKLGRTAEQPSQIGI